MRLVVFRQPVFQIFDYYFQLVFRSKRLSSWKCAVCEHTSMMRDSEESFEQRSLNKLNDLGFDCSSITKVSKKFNAFWNLAPNLSIYEIIRQQLLILYNAKMASETWAGEWCNKLAEQLLSKQPPSSTRMVILLGRVNAHRQICVLLIPVSKTFFIIADRQ